MEKDALKFIQDNSAFPAAKAALEDAGTHVPVAVIPESMGIKSLENYMEFKSRYSKTYKTTNLSQFIKYCQQYDRENAECFIDAQGSLSAQTCFDIGSVELPEHQMHVAMLQLRQTAAFRAIIDLNNSKLDQREASDFIEDWSEYLAVFDKTGDEISTVAAVKAIRSITLESARSMTKEVGDFSEEMTASEKIEAKHDGAGSLPAFLNFTFVPYLGFEPRAFQVRISVLTGGNLPVFSFRITQLEDQLEGIADEFQEKLTDAFEGNKIETFLGTMI